MARPVRKTQAVPKSLPGNRRGRPTAQRVAAIDSAIRTAALALFLEVGFEATSMDAVAAAAPVSKGTLYARYESKELLFRAVLEEELARWSKRAGARDHLLPDTLSPRLRHHARTLIAIFEWPQYRRVNRLIESAILTFPDISRVWQEIGILNYIRFLANDMAKAADVQGISSADLEFHANLFLHGISGWYHKESLVRSLSEDEIFAFSDRVIETIAKALGIEDGSRAS
jgi:AcrR family transcriptional regulator